MGKILRGIHIRAEKEEITDQYVEAIVCPAHSSLTMEGETAEKIKARGGQVIEKSAVLKGPIPLGEAVVTTAGSLLAVNVVHAVVYEKGSPLSQEILRQSVLNSLHRVEELQLESIAFPLMRADDVISAEKSAEVMVDTVIEFINSQPKLYLKEVVFSSDNEKLHALFENIIKQKII